MLFCCPPLLPHSILVSQPTQHSGLGIPCLTHLGTKVPDPGGLAPRARVDLVRWPQAHTVR